MTSLKPSKCPVCKMPHATEHKPFCSSGCKDRDLLQWLGEGYKVPGPPVSTDQIFDQIGGETGRDGEA